MPLTVSLEYIIALMNVYALKHCGLYSLIILRSRLMNGVLLANRTTPALNVRESSMIAGGLTKNEIGKPCVRKE